MVLALKELFETVLKSKQRQMEDFRGGIKSAPENIYSQPVSELDIILNQFFFFSIS